MTKLGKYMDIRIWIFCCISCVLSVQAPAADRADPQTSETGSTAAPPGLDSRFQALTVEDCLDLALANNHRRPISQYALQIAEAQYRQALSGYWPEVRLQGGYTLLDENVTFKYPDMNVAVPAMQIPISGQTIQLPAGALGPGVPPVDIAMPLPDSAIQVPSQNFKVPGEKVDILGRQTVSGELSVLYPLYTGGKRSAVVDQAEAGIDAARQEVRRTDLHIAYDVERMYYAGVMTRELRRIGDETLRRLQVTLELTESLYTQGADGKVRKTDYLRNKLTVEGMQSMLALLAANERMAHAALVHTMGLPWDTQLTLAEGQIPLEELVADPMASAEAAYQFNPDWAALDAGLRAAEAKIREARSDRLPKVALTGSLSEFRNSLDGGLNTADNQHGWSVGIGFQVPLFSGFRTTHQIQEARARLAQLQEQKFLLRDALGVRIRAVIDQLNGAYGQALFGTRAAGTAEENRDLNMRAYQANLLETKDVLEAQLTEAFLKAQAQKARFDYIHARALLAFVVGRDVADRIERDFFVVPE